MIPSQNAIKLSAHVLRKLQHSIEIESACLEYSGDVENVRAGRLQADDLRQVAMFLEGLIIVEKQKRQAKP